MEVVSKEAHDKAVKELRKVLRDVRMLAGPIGADRVITAVKWRTYFFDEFDKPKKSLNDALDEYLINNVYDAN